MLDTNTFKLSKAIREAGRQSDAFDLVKQMLLDDPGLVNQIDDYENYPLGNAARWAHPHVVKLLLDAGADIRLADPDGETALHVLAKEAHNSSGKHVEVVKMLLAAGADVNARDVNERTPLWHVVGEKKKVNLEIVKALVAAGADVNAVGKSGRTAYSILMRASGDASPAMVEALIAAGAKVNATAYAGTALIQAAQDNRADNVATLLEKGADANFRLPADFENADLAGKTALDVARDKKAKKVIPLLEAAPVQAVAAKTPKKQKKVSVAASWKRIEAWLAINNTELQGALRPPAGAEEVAQIENVIGLKLPDDFKEAWKIHNGHEDGESALIPPLDEADGVYGNSTSPGGYYLMACAEIVLEWQSWKGLVDSGEFANQESGPDKGIQDDWWHPGWIPFASNGGGDSICLDLAPTKDGTPGQVITMSHETSTRELLAPSFGQWLAGLADSIEGE